MMAQMKGLKKPYISSSFTEELRQMYEDGMAEELHFNNVWCTFLLFFYKLRSEIYL